MVGKASQTLTALSSPSSVSSPHLNSLQVVQGVVLQSSVSFPPPPPRTTSLASHQLMTTARDQSSASDPPHQTHSAKRATMRKHQVWSLTQFYSLDFLQSRISIKSAFSTNAQSRFASVVVDCPGTFAPSAAHLTVSLYLCSSGSNARGESRV